MKHGAKRRNTTTIWTVVISFFLSLIVFSGAFLVPWFISHWDRPESTETVGEQGHTRTLLLLLHDDDVLTGVVSICGDTRTLAVDVVGYPAQTEVIYRNALCPLSLCYADEGADAASRLASVNGCDFDSVISMSVDAFSAWVSQLGTGISYTLTEPVDVLPQGDQLLTPLQIADVLRFTDWEDPMTGQAAAHAGIVSAVIDQYLNPHCDLEATFNALTALCEQHLTIAQFTVLRPDLQTLANANQQGLCTATVPEGRVTGVGENKRYVLVNFHEKSEKRN